MTCCKRFSAEKRYYPYGRDEEGVAFSIRQGLVNKHRTLRPNSKMKVSMQSLVSHGLLSMCMCIAVKPAILTNPVGFIFFVAAEQS